MTTRHSKRAVMEAPVKGDPACPCCKLDRDAGFDHACIHKAIGFTQEIDGKFHAVVDPCDGKPALRMRKPFDTQQEACAVAMEHAEIMTKQVWAMVSAGPQSISKGGKA